MTPNEHRCYFFLEAASFEDVSAFPGPGYGVRVYIPSRGDLPSMVDEPEEQQEVSEAPTDSKRKTRQEQIIDLYNSNNIHHVAVGFWIKFAVEAVIVGVPIGVLLVPVGFFLAYLDVGPVTFVNTVIAWVSFSASVGLAVWCFTESARSGPAFQAGDDQD